MNGPNVAIFPVFSRHIVLFNVSSNPLTMRDSRTWEDSRVYEYARSVVYVISSNYQKYIF